MNAKEQIDDYTWSEHKKIITADHHGISGLGNISHFTLSSDDPVPLHYHSDIMEIHCIVKGQRTVQIAQDGIMTSYTAMGNELLITRPFEMHETESLSKNRNEFFAIQLNLRNGLSLLGLNDEYSTLLRNELYSLKHRHLKTGHSQLTMLRTAFNLLAFGNEIDKYTAASHLTCFLFSLKYLEPIYHSQEKPINDAIHKAILYVSENIEQPISLQELANISGYSLSHFKFKFKEYFGITPAEYIALQKISFAEKELITTDISITELAYKLSFSSSNYFCTVFKKVLGYRPSDYRKKFQH